MRPTVAMPARLEQPLLREELLQHLEPHVASLISSMLCLIDSGSGSSSASR